MTECKKKPTIKTYLFLNSNIIDTVRLPLISGEKTHSWGKITVEKTSILKVKTSFEFPIWKKLRGLENTVELPSIAGYITHSLGKLTV